MTFLLPLLSLQAQATSLDVDINVGLGPHVLQSNGALAEASSTYLALAFDGYAVLDAKDLKKARKRVPRKYRKYMPKHEARIGLAYIPDQLLLSPSMDSGAGGASPAIWGASWTPISLSQALVDGKRFGVDLSLGATATVAGIEGGDTFDGWMVFARPGLSGKLEAEMKLSKRLVLSGGYNGRAYLPQELGEGTVGSFSAPGDRSLWYLGGGFVQLHVRIPKKVDI
jgi:hypothetical protein